MAVRAYDFTLCDLGLDLGERHPVVAHAREVEGLAADMIEVEQP
jgi:hypothetical protein